MTSIISGERQISYPEIHARIVRAATGFMAFGVGGGTPVGMMLRNDFAFFEVSGAAAALGSPVVPINWHLKAEKSPTSWPTAARKSWCAMLICCRRSAMAFPGISSGWW